MKKSKDDTAKKKDDKPVQPAARMSVWAEVSICSDEVRCLSKLFTDLHGLRRLLKALSTAYPLTGSEVDVLAYACQNMADRMETLTDALRTRYDAARKNSSKEEKK